MSKMADRVLLDAYAKISSDKPLERSSGLAELKQILSLNKNSKDLGDKGYHMMFEAIFGAALKEKTLYTRQKKPSSVIIGRFSLCGSVFRLAVELGVKQIKAKTFKAVYSHIIDILPQNEGLCEPICLNYLRALRSCLEYAPHAEHLAPDDWEIIATFCCTNVESQLRIVTEEGGDVDMDVDSDEGMGDSVLAVRGARPSLVRDSSSMSKSAIPPTRTGVPLNHHSEQLLLCLQILLRTSNAPVVATNEMTCRTILGFLTSQPTVTRVHHDVLSALNSILEVITTNNITLSSKVAEAIVPVITKMWDSKSSKEQMMITLIYLQPHLRKLMRSLTGASQKNFRRRVEALSDVIFTEYSTRAERDQLQLEDICFPDPSKDLDIETTPLALAAYCLRSDVPSRTEQHWTVPYLMAMLIEILDLDRNDDQDRSKRRKVSTKFDELLMNAKSMIHLRKICALQTLPFLIRESQRTVDQEGFSSLIADLLNVCSDDSPVISSWAMISISSCAFLRFASDPGNTQIWNQTWHLCARYSANLSTCRAACHLMRILLALDLVPYSEISASVDATILSIDLSGPSNVIDSSLAVWRLILEKRNTVAHSSLLQPGERLFQWFISKWRPVETLERVTAAFYVHHGTPKDICSFLFSCCGKRSLEFDSYIPRTYGLVGQAIIRAARCSKLLNFLLLEETLDSWNETGLAGGPKLKTPKMTSSFGTVSHPGVELQVIEFLDRECEGILERWNQLTQTSTQQPSSDMVQNYVGFIFTAGLMCSILRPRDTTKADALSRKLETLTLYLVSYIERDDCKELHLDGILRCMSGILPRPASIVDRSFPIPEVFQGFFGSILCTISKAFEDKIKGSAITEVTEGSNEMMDLDDGFGMELRGFGDKGDGELSREEVQAMCSPETFRYSTTALLALFARSIQFKNSSEICESFVDYLQHLPIPRLIMCRLLFRDFLAAANLKDDDADQLIQHVGSSMLQDYETDRCETAAALCIDLLNAFVGRWAVDKAGGELVADCEQIYAWMAKVALEKSLFSHTIRTSMAQLLGRMLEVNPGYGKNSNNTSARSQFIKRLQDRDVRVTFFMANCTSVLFRIYGLASHQVVMDDVLKHLTDEIEWIEGLSMRVYTLSQLADTTFSMNKLIVYHIFETGQLESMVKYAARSLSFVAKALKLGDHRSLFKIFSPQIIYTWIENADLAVFPFRAFGYQSHKDLFSDIQEDLVAQLLMRGKDNAAKELALMLGVTYDELLEKGFHKIVAYGAAWAVGVPPKDGRYRSVDARIRKHIGANEYKKLLEKNFALIIASLFQIMQEDGTSEKFLAKDPNFSVARDLMKDITGISHSTAKLPDPLQPFFKVKVVLNSINHICTRVGYDDSRLWSPAMFTFVVRRLFDTMDPALGSLHACAVVRKIRLLVCLAREQALRGYALEMVVHGLKPFIVDKYCTGDTIGVLQYLLSRGKDYFSRQPAFVTGTFLSILAPLRTFIPAPTSYRGKTDGQLYASHSAARKFRSWLGGFLLKYKFTELSSQQNQMFQSIVEAAIEFKSGNASARTKESDLLRHLLDDDRNKNRLLDDVSRGLAFSLVCSDFQRPQSFRDDIFGEDQDSVERSRVLLRTCRRLDVNKGFLLWCARVLGRSYAASGEIYNEWTQEIELEKMIEFDNKRYDLDIVPKAGILHRLRSLLLGEDRIVIGITEKTLETIFFEETEANDITTFDVVFKEDFYSALKWTTLPTSLAEAEVPRPIMTVGRPETLPVDVWIKNLAAAISTNLQQDAIVKNLRPILEKVEGLAKDLFPFIVHILLLHNLGSERLPMELSQLFRDCFKTCTEKTVPHTIILINTILYLRTQPMVDEVTQLPRDYWLDVDYLDMAHAACTCKMFKTSLLFAEIHHSESNSEFSESDLLLEIFKNIDDLDSYYGVTQSPSLETTVSQSEYEEDGWKGLSFRGANLESQLRLGCSSNGQDIGGLVDAFNAIGMNGLSHYFLQSGVAPASTTDNMFRSAWKLEQWDLPCPSSCNTRSAIVYRTLQSVNNSVDTRAIPSHLDSSFLELMLQITTEKQTGHSLAANMRTLAVLTEMEEILGSKEAGQLEKVWDRLQERENWMHIGRFSDIEEIMAMRQAIFSSLAKREHLRHFTRIDMKTARFLEAKALVDTCKMARSHKVLQHSLSAATQLSKAVDPCKEVGLKIDAVATLQAANVLWDQGRGVPPIKMLQILEENCLNQQSIVIGRAKLLAKLGNWISEARLEKPDKIMSTYLGPAIKELKGNISGREAGRVFHEFASFCDQQLQNPGNIEDFQRALKLRQNKEAEVKELEKLLLKSPAKERNKLERMTANANLWLKLDNEELNKLQENRDAFLEKSIGNYLLCLAACDDYDNDAVRFCALWLEHSGDAKVNNAAEQPLATVPSRKFVPLMNQLSSRLLDVQDNFQKLLYPLIARICKDHPHHGTYQILALGRSPKGAGSEKRDAAAVKLISELGGEAGTREIFGKLFNSTDFYISLAKVKLSKKAGKISFKVFSPALAIESGFMKEIPGLGVPPPTMQITIRADCNYANLAVIDKFEPEFTIASGISAPKILSCRASDGVRYKMLFKGGPDDLRQDAIMEQVFEQVSNLLKKNRTTRQRNLSIRTYKVVPLTNDTGIIEFVPNTIPLHDFLLPAHDSYHPKDMKHPVCRKLIFDAQTQLKSRDFRVAVFQKVMKKFKPVMRYFFMHKFNGPDDWFTSRLAYSRSTAATSILGHVLGLGDRHGHNILLDEKSGEVVHIDLGVAFEQGRILPVPEVVPFRLTRDIIDGMGITKTEGVFRRCCEFTLTVLRNESYNITTILDVLRYDPLYSWTISPLRMKRMQKQEEEEEPQAERVPVKRVFNPEKEEGESEADRALTVVAKKLSKTLSVGATVNELIQQASDVGNLAVLFAGWAAYV